MTLHPFFLRAILTLAFVPVLALPARALDSLQSTFDQNTEGWTVSGGASAPTHGFVLGSDGGFIQSTDTDSANPWYWVAPSKFLGNRAAAYGGRLQFRIWQSYTTGASTGGVPDVVLEAGVNRLVCTIPPLGNFWNDCSVLLTESAGWRYGTLTGPAPDASMVKYVLGNLTAVRIRGDYRRGSEIGGLDSVVMELPSIPPPAALPVTSSFDADDEGWRVVGDGGSGPSAPAYEATGGVNKLGQTKQGYISATGAGQSGVWYWSAPAKFLGNMSGALGETLQYYLTQPQRDNPFNAPDVILEGAGHRFVYRQRYRPNPAWTVFRVYLQPQLGWHVNTLTGRTPTEAEFREALTLPDRLWIRGEYTTDSDTGGLDEVYLGHIAGLSWGDADKDHAVTAADAATVLRIAAGFQSTQPAVMDTADVAPVVRTDFGDGRLDILDAVRILRYVNHLEPRWP